MLMLSIGFYFKVLSNFSVQTEVKFNILNLCKAKSLYQYGMKILVLDTSQQQEDMKQLP